VYSATKWTAEHAKTASTSAHFQRRVRKLVIVRAITKEMNYRLTSKKLRRGFKRKKKRRKDRKRPKSSKSNFML
jgi:hypothetical protein